EWVVGKVQKAVPNLPENLAPFLESFVHAAEDIYIDELARPKVWSLYLSSFWKTDGVQDARDPALPPSAASLALAWRTRETHGPLPECLHHYYNDPLERLRKCTRGIREVVSLSSPAARREKRVDLYLETWRSLQEILSAWEDFASSPDAINLFDEAAQQGRLPDAEDTDEGERENEREEREGVQGLEPDLAEEVMNLVEDQETDLTRTILVAVEDPEAGSMRTRVRQGTARMAMQPDPLLVKQLKKIFNEQASLVRRARRRRVRRGLIEGNLDARRLHRVPIDGKVFKTREPPTSEHSWQICLVADGSASMAGKGARQKPWPVAERAFASLAEASKGSRNRVDIYAYHEERNRCTLTQLYHGGDLYTVVPSGRTPSGQAIMAAAVTLRERRQRSIIIHITDGASNCGVRLSDAVEFCERNAIELFTIGCGCSQQTKDFLRECFPFDRLYFMRTIRTLPLVLERLLRQRILFPIRQGRVEQDIR
ncbi:MAG: vWA domain-containing protein, partial [Thermodesulfobacteriota bacterium]